MKKRIISLFLALTLCVGMLPAPAWAEEPTDPTQAAGVVQDTNPSEETDPTTEPTEEETEPTEEETEPTEEETEPTEEETEPTEALLDQTIPEEVAVYAASLPETISGTVTLDNYQGTETLKLDQDTTLVLKGENKIECEKPLDLNGHELIIQGTGSLELVGSNNSGSRQTSGAIYDSTWTSTSSPGGGMVIESGTVIARDDVYNAVAVRYLYMNGGKLEAYGARSGIVTTQLQMTAGSLYATGSTRNGIDMWNPYYVSVNGLNILVSNEPNAQDTNMEDGTTSQIEDSKKKTVAIGKFSTSPSISVQAQQGYLYEATAKTATFALSGRNVDLSALTLEWTGAHTGLVAEASADGKTLTVTTDKTVQAGTYGLKVSAGEASRTVVVTVSGPPICIYERPVDTISADPEAGLVSVSAYLTKGHSGFIDFQWKQEDGTVMDGYTGENVPLIDLVELGMLTQDASKPWLQTIRIYCTLSYDGYSLNTDTVTVGLNSCKHEKVDHEGNCALCGEKRGSNEDALIVREDGLYHLISNEEAGDANVGPFMYGGGNFWLTGDVQKTTVDVSDADGGGKNVTLDLQGHTVKNLKMGNFPYGTFTVKNGTLGEIHTSASGKLILENILYQGKWFDEEFDLTVQGENTRFERQVTFWGTTHLSGGRFSQGLDSNCAGRALELLEDGFAFYDNDNKVVDATDSSRLTAREIHVASHICSYRYGKCACGRSCDHQGTTDEKGYCTNCGTFVYPFAIGEKLYTDLGAALTAAQEGDTVTLRGDYDMQGAAVEIKKSITLELNGHTLSSWPYAPILTILAPDVTIQNGTVKNTDTSKSSRAVEVGSLSTTGATLTVKDAIFEGSESNGNPRNYGLSIFAGNTAQVENGTFTGGISVNGSLTLSGGKADHIYVGTGVTYASLLAKGYAYQAKGQLVKPEDMAEGIAVEVVKCGHPDGLTDTEACAYCGLTCPHSTVSAETGLCQECGSQVYEANVTTADGSVTGYRTLEEALRNGADATVKLLADCKGEDTFCVTEPLTLDLNGKRMEGPSGLIVKEGPTTILDSSPAQTGTIAGTSNWKYSGVGLGVLNNANVKLTILGGHFEGKTDGLQVVGQNTLILEGGSFSSIHFTEGATATLWDALAPGYAYYDADNTLYDPGDGQGVTVGLHVGAHPEHTPDSSGHCPCGYTAAAMLDTEAGKQYFADFSAAVDAAKAATGSTLTLLRDVTHSGDSGIYIDGGTFTIDWNGHTLTGSPSNNLMVITNLANVTLKDSSGNNTGGACQTGYGMAVYIAVGSEGSVKIQGGTYSPNVTRSQRCYGSVQISGGVFENPNGHGMTCALFDLSGNHLSGMLAPGYTFAYEDDDSLFYVYNVKMSEAYRSVCVVEHPTHELDDDTDTCACGFHCDHKDVGDDGVCAACGSQMAASVTAEDDGSVTYYRNIADAIAAATASPDPIGHCDTTVTLLNDIDETISNNGMDFVLDLNGKTLAGLELKDYHFALMDSRQTGTIEQLYSDFHGYTYLKEGWCLVDADGMSLNLLTRLETSEPIRVVHAGVVDIERSEWGTVSYGQQTIPFSLRFRLEDGLEVSSVKVSWTYEVAVREPIGSVQTLTKDEDGFYTFDTSKPLDEHPLNYERLRAELTYVLLSQIELELEDGQTRSIVLSGYRISTEKADLSDAVITLDSTALTYAPNPQTAVGQEQTKAVTSVTLYGNTLTEGTDYEVTGNVGTNAGTYTLTVKAKADSKFYTGSKTVTWEIKPLPIEDMMFSGQNKLYDGTANVNPLRCEYLTTKDSQLIYGIQAGADYNVVSVSDYNSPDVHDGDLLAVTVEFPGNYVGLDGTNRMELTVIGQITPAEAPAQGGVTVTVTNGNVATYTVENLDMALSDLTAPCTYGTITYGTPTVKTLDEAYAMTAVIENGALRLNVTGTGETVGQVATVTVPVQTSNYRDFTLTVYVEAKNKTVPQVKAVGTTEICYGQKLEESRVLSSQVYEPDSETTVPGSFRWEEPETLLDAGTHPMKMIFTPEDTSKYAQTTAMVNVTVNPRPVTLSGVTVADKIYDGTAEATVKDKGTFSNAVSGDTMDYTVTAAFEDKNVAAGGEKTAYLTVTLNGDTGKNYTLAEDSQKEARARMFPKEVNITGGFTAQDRDYAPDNPSVQIIQGEVTFDKKAEGDDLGAQVNGGTVATPEAGQNRTVTYSATLTGEDKDNYTLGSVPEITVTIRPIAQTLAFAEAAVTKTYGDSPFVNALTHSVGDGQITYTSSDPAVATVGTDGTVTILKSGTAKITAEAGATQNYVKTSASFDLTVDKAPGTLENKDYPTKFTYGDTVPTPKAENFTTNNPDGTFDYYWETESGTMLEAGANPISAGNYTLHVKVASSGNYETVQNSFTVTVSPLEITDKNIAFDLGEALIYNGKSQKAAFRSITANGMPLNYTLTGNTATDAGSYTMTVTGQGSFTGSVEIPWKIQPRVLTYAKITQGDSLTYNGRAQTQTVASVTVDGIDRALTEGVDFQVSGNTGTNAGDYMLTVESASSNFTGSADQPWSIAPLDISKANVVTIDYAPLTYNGKPQTPTGVTVTADGLNVTVDVAVTPQTDAGFHDMTVTGKGNFTGSKDVPWSIAPKDIGDAKVELGAELTYNFEAQTQTIASVTVDGLNVPTYTVIDNTGTDAGDYTLTVVADGNFTGTQTAKWTIAKLDISKLDISKVDVWASYEDLTFNGKAQTPNVTAAWLSTGTKRMDITYDVDVTPQVNAGEYKLAILGTGNFTGRKEFDWEIMRKNIQDAKVVFGPGLTYNGQRQTRTITSVTVDGISGALIEGVDYLVNGNTGIDADRYILSILGLENYNGHWMGDWEIAKKDVTIEDTAVESTRVYDGTTAAKITNAGTLSANYDGDGLQIVSGTAAYDNKNVGTGKTVTFTGFSLTGDQAHNYNLVSQPASVTADITAKEITLSVSVKDKVFDGTTQAELDTVTHTDFVAGDDVELVNGEPSFAYPCARADIPIRFTDFRLTGADAGNYRLTNAQPEGVTAEIHPTPNYLDVTDKPEFDDKTTVTVDGVEYPIEETGDRRYVNLPETGDLLTIYSFKDGTPAGSYTNYPTGMQVFRITRQEGGATAEEITELANLLNYAGCSIRVSGKKGIRMITGIDQNVKKSLVSKAGLAGYTLEEYGTVVQWADTLGSNTLNLNSSDKQNYAYKKGKADPIFAKADGMIQYTNVLVGFTDAQCQPDLVMRPYIKLKDTVTDETVTLYGGCVTRSIGYVAWQNRDTYKPGTASYKYVHKIINAVYDQEP